MYQTLLMSITDLMYRDTKYPSFHFFKTDRYYYFDLIRNLKTLLSSQYVWFLFKSVPRYNLFLFC